MMGCDLQESGTIDLYFYGELPAVERHAIEQHVARCAECRGALDELRTIRSALAERPVVDAPPQGDWGPFMSRLDAAVAGERHGIPITVPPAPTVRHGMAGFLAMAALLTMVTAGVGYLSLHPASKAQPAPVSEAGAPAGSDDSTDLRAPRATGREDMAFAAVSEQHFERSKLVILGIANKDSETASSADWAYERGLAGVLLDDTRLYRRAAQERGLGSLVGVMSDLELVLLQTSLADEPDRAALDRLQRLIRKRDLLTKMEMTRF
jgi:hypothetical protein